MFRSVSLVTLLSAFSMVALGMSPAAFADHAPAPTQVGTYSIGTTPFVSLVCSPDCLVEGNNIGGYTFQPLATRPVQVDIADDSGLPVPFTVCQDADGNGLCGETGEPRLVGCSTTADLGTAAVAFREDLATSVFIRVAQPGCLGPAAGGSITVTYFVPLH